MNTIKGNLITLSGDDVNQFNIIVHGCNCFNTMGAGIAPQIAEAYPEAWEADQITRPGFKKKMGTITVGYHPRSYWGTLVVINGYTQYAGAGDGERAVDYDALRSVFQRVYHVALTVRNARIGYPMIGAGLAGGDWDIISDIIDEELQGLDHTLVEYDG